LKKVFIGVLAFALFVSMAPRLSPSVCCGVNPYFDLVNVALDCYFIPGTISGVVRGVEEWYDAYSTTASVEVEIQSPSGVVTNQVAILSNLQEFPSGTNIGSYATWDFSVSYTPEEAGTYTYVLKAAWTSALSWTMYRTQVGTFEVDYCLTPGKVTGGGWIQTGEVKNTFGFNAQSTDGETVKGNVEFQAHEFLNLKSTAINTLYVNGNWAVITGDCLINGEEGYTFVLIVEDNGEPGKGADKFTLSWNPGINGFISVGDTIDQGSIQIHDK
jgi:hypothetical protein